ncbi:unnamed protein product [Amoebophrya sp. A25]|nr:unnamed protein product [Amoebophrya sp. A25]|eukprot:GSA25T00003980001.1
MAQEINRSCWMDDACFEFNKVGSPVHSTRVSEPSRASANSSRESLRSEHVRSEPLKEQTKSKPQVFNIGEGSDEGDGAGDSEEHVAQVDLVLEQGMKRDSSAPHGTVDAEAESEERTAQEEFHIRGTPGFDLDAEFLDHRPLEDLQNPKTDDHDVENPEEHDQGEHQHQANAKAEQVLEKRDDEDEQENPRSPRPPLVDGAVDTSNTTYHPEVDLTSPTASDLLFSSPLHFSFTRQAAEPELFETTEEEFFQSNQEPEPDAPAQAQHPSEEEQPDAPAQAQHPSQDQERHGMTISVIAPHGQQDAPAAIAKASSDKASAAPLVPHAPRLLGVPGLLPSFGRNLGTTTSRSGPETFSLATPRGDSDNEQEPMGYVEPHYGIATPRLYPADGSSSPMPMELQEEERLGSIPPELRVSPENITLAAREDGSGQHATMPSGEPAERHQIADASSLEELDEKLRALALARGRGRSLSPAPRPGPQLPSDRSPSVISVTNDTLVATGGEVISTDDRTPARGPAQEDDDEVLLSNTLTSSNELQGRERTGSTDDDEMMSIAKWRGLRRQVHSSPSSPSASSRWPGAAGFYSSEEQVAFHPARFGRAASAPEVSSTSGHLNRDHTDEQEVLSESPRSSNKADLLMQTEGSTSTPRHRKQPAALDVSLGSLLSGSQEGGATTPRHCFPATPDDQTDVPEKADEGYQIQNSPLMSGIDRSCGSPSTSAVDQQQLSGGSPQQQQYHANPNMSPMANMNMQDYSSEHPPLVFQAVPVAVLPVEFNASTWGVDPSTGMMVAAGLGTNYTGAAVMSPWIGNPANYSAFQQMFAGTTMFGGPQMMSDQQEHENSSGRHNLHLQEDEHYDGLHVGEEDDEQQGHHHQAGDEHEDVVHQGSRNEGFSTLPISPSSTCSPPGSACFRNARSPYGWPSLASSSTAAKKLRGRSSQEDAAWRGPQLATPWEVNCAQTVSGKWRQYARQRSLSRRSVRNVGGACASGGQHEVGGDEHDESYHSTGENPRKIFLSQHLRTSPRSGSSPSTSGSSCAAGSPPATATSSHSTSHVGVGPLGKWDCSARLTKQPSTSSDVVPASTASLKDHILLSIPTASSSTTGGGSSASTGAAVHLGGGGQEGHEGYFGASGGLRNAHASSSFCPPVSPRTQAHMNVHYIPEDSKTHMLDNLERALMEKGRAEENMMKGGTGTGKKREEKQLVDLQDVNEVSRTSPSTSTVKNKRDKKGGKTRPPFRRGATSDLSSSPQADFQKNADEAEEGDEKKTNSVNEPPEEVKEERDAPPPVEDVLEEHAKDDHTNKEPAEGVNDDHANKEPPVTSTPCGTSTIANEDARTPPQTPLEEVAPLLFQDGSCGQGNEGALLMDREAAAAAEEEAKREMEEACRAMKRLGIKVDWGEDRVEVEAEHERKDAHAVDVDHEEEQQHVHQSCQKVEERDDDVQIFAGVAEDSPETEMRSLREQIQMPPVVSSTLWCPPCGATATSAVPSSSTHSVEQSDEAASTEAAQATASACAEEVVLAVFREAFPSCTFFPTKDWAGDDEAPPPAEAPPEPDFVEEEKQEESNEYEENNEYEEMKNIARTSCTNIEQLHGQHPDQQDEHGADEVVLPPCTSTSSPSQQSSTMSKSTAALNKSQKRNLRRRNSNRNNFASTLGGDVEADVGTPASTSPEQILEPSIGGSSSTAGSATSPLVLESPASTVAGEGGDSVGGTPSAISQSKKKKLYGRNKGKSMENLDQVESSKEHVVVKLKTSKDQAQTSQATKTTSGRVRGSCSRRIPCCRTPAAAALSTICAVAGAALLARNSAAPSLCSRGRPQSSLFYPDQEDADDYPESSSNWASWASRTMADVDVQSYLSPMSDFFREHVEYLRENCYVAPPSSLLPSPYLERASSACASSAGLSWFGNGQASHSHPRGTSPRGPSAVVKKNATTRNVWPDVAPRKDIKTTSTYSNMLVTNTVENDLPVVPLFSRGTAVAVEDLAFVPSALASSEIPKLGVMPSIRPLDTIKLKNIKGTTGYLTPEVVPEIRLRPMLGSQMTGTIGRHTHTPAVEGNENVLQIKKLASLPSIITVDQTKSSSKSSSEVITSSQESPSEPSSSSYLRLSSSTGQNVLAALRNIASSGASKLQINRLPPIQVQNPPPTLATAGTPSAAASGEAGTGGAETRRRGIFRLQARQDQETKGSREAQHIEESQQVHVQPRHEDFQDEVNDSQMNRVEVVSQPMDVDEQAQEQQRETVTTNERHGHELDDEQQAVGVADFKDNLLEEEEDDHQDREGPRGRASIGLLGGIGAMIAHRVLAGGGGDYDLM